MFFSTLRPKSVPPSARPEDDRECLYTLRHRFSRAWGVLHEPVRDLYEMERGPSESHDLSTYKPDCLEEVLDAVASDAYRGFFEREFGARIRLVATSEEPRGDPTWTLHAIRPESISAWEEENRRTLDRRTLEHGFHFGLGVIESALGGYRRSRQGTYVHERPSIPDPERKDLRNLMAAFPFRDRLQWMHGVAFGFQLPHRLCVAKAPRGRPLSPLETERLRTQIQLEHGKSRP